MYPQDHIEGVKIFPLKKICDERGMIMHMLRSDAPHFEQFGEIYFSMAYPGVVKGWHEHTKQIQNYAVVVGMIRLVLYDARKESPSFQKLMKLCTGESRYQLIRIPPGVINGYQVIGEKPALIANCASLAHDPTEMIRYPVEDPTIPYRWHPEAEKQENGL